MGLKKINLCAMIVCLSAFASASNAVETWLDKAIVRTAVAWNELDLGHISYLSTYKSTAITYRTRARQYGPSIYRVELDFEGRTPDGGLFFAHKNNYLIMLLTSGQTEAYRDNSSELLYWVDKKFNAPSERRNDILPDEYLDADPKLAKFRPQARAAAESLVNATRSLGKLIAGDTLLVNHGYAERSGSLFYEFEVVTQAPNTSGVLCRRYVIVNVAGESGQFVEPFMDDTKFNRTTSGEMNPACGVN